MSDNTSKKEEMNNNEIAIKVDKVCKVYKLYNRNRDRFLDALGISREKGYTEHRALDDMSFEVKKGETVGIIGTNGAGKSTILKIITGVLNQTSGDVTVNGRISALLELGAGFNMEYTGIENVYLNGSMIGFSKEEIDEKLDDIISFADIGEYINQPVKTYSSGMFVRLAFAVAINIDPEILIVDEALSVGDVFFQAKCYNKFEEFKKMGKTVLFVSHDLSSISKYCDRAILMDHGKKRAEGSPKDMINLYKKIIVGSMTLNENGEEETANNQEETGKLWKDSLTINPNLDEYGDGKAKIIDFAIVDDEGSINSSIIKGAEFTIKSKVLFHEDIDNPIFTFTFKNIKGVDITGTNTMIEKKMPGLVKAGEVYVAEFKQRMNLQGGDYLLSISCTGFEEGVLTAHDRMYDVLNVTVVSDKDTVGFFDMESEVTVTKVKA